jgi:hypothetical protein
MAKAKPWVQTNCNGQAKQQKCLLAAVAYSKDQILKKFQFKI